MQKNTPPLVCCTLGMAILGYLGYRVVIWILDKYRTTAKVDQVAQKSLINLATNIPISSDKIRIHLIIPIGPANRSVVSNHISLMTPDSRALHHTGIISMPVFGLFVRLPFDSTLPSEKWPKRTPHQPLAAQV